MTEEATALECLVNREEVLQICYWYQGEGFGEAYNATALGSFLNCDAEAINAALEELTGQGYLVAVASPPNSFCFTARGKKEGGRLFADSFSDFQKAGHGECAAGCCDEDDHSQCGDDCSLH
ncbi:MAG: hypothetical protein DSY87_07815 [Methylococcus sp.]|nr:MAG: hypothetical protein DSY87_07815 [Methylococcus sp.]